MRGCRSALGRASRGRREARCSRRRNLPAARRGARGGRGTPVPVPARPVPQVPPAGLARSVARRLRRARHPRDRGRRGLGGQAGSSRRIESFLGFPAIISGTELTSRAVTQARKFNARTATPYRALSLEPGNGWHCRPPRGRPGSRSARSAARNGRPVPAAPGRPSCRVRGTVCLLRRRCARGAAFRRPVLRRCRRRQLRRPGRSLARPGRRARHSPPPPRGPSRDDVGLPCPRARAVRRRRPRPERDRRAPRQRRAPRGGGASSDERVPLSFMFLFLGALPCTDWLDDTVGRDRDGFIVTGAAANMDNLLDTDRSRRVRGRRRPSGSTKRCAAPSAKGRWRSNSSTRTSPAPPAFKKRDELARD